MSRVRKLAGILIIISVLTVLVPSTVLAVPQFPMQFYGDVTIGGVPAPDGTLIEAKIDGVVYASTTVKDGRYGYDPVFLVPADDPETAEKEGGTEIDIIEFFIGEARIGTATFVSGGGPSEGFDLPALEAPANIVKTSPDTDDTPTFTWDPLPPTAAEVASYEVMIDTGDWIDVGDVTTFTVADDDALADGSHTFKVRAVDQLANRSTSGSLDFIVDTTLPTTPSNITRTSADADSTPTFTWDAASDATSGVASYQVRIDSGDFSDVGNVTTFTVADDDALADGSHTLEVKAVDSAGNVGEAGGLTFTIDATPPTTPTNITKTTPDSDDTPTFTWDAATDVTSGVASYQVRIDSGDFTDVGNVTTFTVESALRGGSHTFEVRAVDGAGNTGIAGSLSFEVARPSNWPIILGVIAGALVVIGAAAYSIGRRRATRPSRG